ncbi:hypothetical protein DPMN_013250 [Dreissena polymorpha]|uniref:Uncharacterized protein n=1 Tax=Dreissena polymorpha TaxID=45954 RepID=A0A9D4S1P2_DREPO|nr:hypothetical protein DPMN_013250 [Dreissena polymorpha]
MEIIKSVIEFETRMPRAIAKAMKAVFTKEQVLTCSFKGGITTKGYPHVGLPEAERKAIIEYKILFSLLICMKETYQSSSLMPDDDLLRAPIQEQSWAPPLTKDKVSSPTRLSQRGR